MADWAIHCFLHVGNLFSGKPRMASGQIYLDYNATTPVAPSVSDAILPFLTKHYGNPSSDHALGRACHHAIEDARDQVAKLIGAESDEIVFTSGGSESNNLAIKGVARLAKEQGKRHLVTTAIEHPAVTCPISYLAKNGFESSIVPCDQHGVVSVAAMEEALREDTALVSVMHANNETGAVQPVAQIGSLCRRRGITFHTDAAQSVGKIPADVDELNVDLLTIVGHKTYAPKGSGALYVRRGTALEPLVHGADHEWGLRAGTENVPYIVGLGKAANLTGRRDEAANNRLRTLRDSLQEQLAAEIGDRLQVNAGAVERLPNTLSVNLLGVSSRDLLARVPEVLASTGAACHSGSDAVSGTLAAMGVTADEARGTIRFSVGWPTSLDEIDRAASLILGAWESLR
jgi:cysteine desulfurase